MVCCFCCVVVVLLWFNILSVIADCILSLNKEISASANMKNLVFHRQ